MEGPEGGGAVRGRGGGKPGSAAKPNSAPPLPNKWGQSACIYTQCHGCLPWGVVISGGLQWLQKLDFYSSRGTYGRSVADLAGIILMVSYIAKRALEVY